MSWRRCQQRWKLDYLDGIRQKIYGVHMDFGTSVHYAIEKYRTRKDPVGVEMAVALFEAKFNELYDANGDRYAARERDIERSFFVDAGRTILRRFSECKEIAEAEVVHNEYELNLPIDRTDDVKVNFKGFIDMIIKTKDKRGNSILYVCDFKTCSWGWDREKREDRELHFQILLYKHFICKKFNLDPKGVRTAFILLKKKPRKGDSPVEFFPISAGPVSVQRALDSLNKDLSEMAARVTAGGFVKNRSECVSKFGDICPYKSTKFCPDDPA